MALLPRTKTDLLLIGMVLASAAAWFWPEYSTLILVAGLVLFVLYAGTISGPGYVLERDDFAASEYARAEGSLFWSKIVPLGFWLAILFGPTLVRLGFDLA